MQRSRLFIVLLVLLGSSPVWGLTADILPGLFPEARQLQVSQSDVENFRLALGPLKKINNQWRAERERRVDGQLQRRTIEIEEGYSVDEVQQQVRDALLQRDARPLYTCSGLDCGSSNAWANNLFNVKQLYGLDQNQHYGLWEWQARDGELFYLATYVVQRGNRRIYAHMDRLQVPAQAQGSLVANPATLVDSLKREGYLVLSGIKWGRDAVRIDPDHLEALRAALQRDPWLQVYVVGHDYGPGDLSQQTERSLKAAEQVRKALLDLGVAAERVSAHGVGSLAPAGARGDGRIEIVRR